MDSNTPNSNEQNSDSQSQTPTDSSKGSSGETNSANPSVPSSNNANTPNPSNTSNTSNTQNNSEAGNGGQDSSKQQGIKRKRAESGEPAPSKKARTSTGKARKIQVPTKIDREPAKRNQPDDTKFTIIIGKLPPYKYKISPEDFDWSDPEAVKKLNLYRQQVLRRAFGPKRQPRNQYTRAEEKVLGRVLKKYILKAKSKANLDWEAVAKEHNRRMEKKDVQKGAKYAYTKKSARQPKDKAATPSDESAATKKTEVKTTRKTQSDKAKADSKHVARTATALKNQASRFASMDAILATKISEDWEFDEEAWNKESDEESEGDTEEDSDTGSDEEDEEESDDNGLEEESDDEEDGQRPASNPLGGTLVAAVGA